MPDDRGYEFFEHTADVGLKATGRTLEELFHHAAQGLVELLVEESAISPKEMRVVTLSAPSVEALLHAWLSELIVWFDADRFVPGAYAFDELDETGLRAQVSGERFDPSRHLHGVEVKGVTRHQFHVTHTGGRWRATLIFDV